MRKRIITLILLISAFLSLNACSDGMKLRGQSEEKIMVVSDIHLLADSLEGKEKYTKDILTRDGRVQELDYEIVDALIKKVNEIRPDALCITGDLSFNGARASHEELARLLNDINSNTKVLVIPGNHDMYNIKTYTYENDEPKNIKSIDYDEFRMIYEQFGYKGAYSYDETTLSYIWELNSNTWLLMLDANLSKYNEDFDMNISGGALEEDTVNWIQKNLSYAYEHGIKVISFTHQNLITHNQRFTNGYNISNADELIELYEKYGVKVNFSGHLHIQNIKEQNGIYDIASGGLLDYGNRYGLLECYENGYKYTSTQLTIEGMDLAQTAFDVFCSKYAQKGAVNDLACELNAYYFDGNYKKIHDLISKNSDAVSQIREAQSEYFDEVLNVPNENQDNLIIIK